MAFDIDDWVERTQNHYWDVDGYAGAQCWDLWAKYCMDAFSLPMGACITPTGWAGGIWTQYPTNPQIEQTFEKQGSDYTPVKGDVVFWQVCGAYPYTHVAIVLDGIDGDMIDVLTQNPEPSVHKKLPLERAHVGYLHPRNLPSGGSTPSGDNPTGTHTPTVTQSGGRWIETTAGGDLVEHRTVNGKPTAELFRKSTSNTWIYSLNNTASGDNTNGGDTDSGQSSASIGATPGYALYVIGSVESSLRWDAVESNLQGIGIAQWSFGRRIDVLKAMKQADPDGWTAFAAAAPQVAQIVDNGGDFTRPLTTIEADAFRTFAGRGASHAGQREQFAADYKSYPTQYTDPKLQILWVCAYHQSPAGALDVPKATTLEGLKTNILATPPFGPYTNRYQTAYNLLRVWDGTSNPPNF